MCPVDEETGAHTARLFYFLMFLLEFVHGDVRWWGWTLKLQHGWARRQEDTSRREQDEAEWRMEYDGWRTDQDRVKRGVEGERRGSICLLPLPIGTAVSQSATDADSQKGEAGSDNSPWSFRFSSFPAELSINPVVKRHLFLHHHLMKHLPTSPLTSVLCKDNLCSSP